MKFIEGYHRYILTNDVLTLLRSDFSYKTWIFIRHQPGTISPTKNDSEKVWRLCIVIKKLKPYPLSNFKLANSSSALASTMRSALLTGVSLLMTAAVIGNAYYQRQQFYPSVVYITKSNPSMAVIYVQAFVVGKFIRYTYRKAIRKKKMVGLINILFHLPVILFGKLMRKIWFGTLRAAEL